ncbi:hypothetical protein ACH5RR_032980 [Cinchona calisaya]|uniref:GAG-pre-integrase domain-containing protein n=1 Tax=Cinchona calisaya TaxID=153742 RepID=A0ABD2YJP2_9GENT
MNGFVETISNVLYVPELKSNLLSASVYCKKRVMLSLFRRALVRFMILLDGAILVLKKSTNRLFPLKIETIQSYLMDEVKDPSWLWHFRYDHLSFGGLKTLQQKNIVTGLPQISVKQYCSQFPQGKSWRAKGILELDHFNICGPIKPSSNGGKRYLITFIDDYSRKIWIYFFTGKVRSC